MMGIFQNFCLRNYKIKKERNKSKQMNKNKKYKKKYEKTKAVKKQCENSGDVVTERKPIEDEERSDRKQGKVSWS